MKKITILLFTIMMALGMTANAQGILDRLERKAKQKTEDKALEKADDKMDEALDKLFEKKQKEKAPEETDDIPESQTFEESESGASAAEDQADAMAMMEKYGMMSDVELDETYRFDHEVKMKMKTFEKGKLEEEMDMVMLFSENEAAMGMLMQTEQNGQPTDMKTIVDMENEQMVSLIDNEGMKMGMQYKMNQQDWEEMAATSEESESSGSDNEMDIHKTGRSKKILGYTCDEYVATDEDGAYSEVWVTDDLAFMNYWTAMSKANKNADYGVPGAPNGFMMEMTSWPDGKSGKERVEMKATEVNKNKTNEISTAGYRFMSMGR